MAHSSLGRRPRATFEDWTGRRTLSSWGTNSGADDLPFQKWRHFKEAFAPELIARAVADNPVPVTRCLDPFGGSGTTALACQFLDVEPVTMEVNPFLADLIESKLATYETDALARALGTVLRRSTRVSSDPNIVFGHLPPTFVEPGVAGRWIFDRGIAARLGALLVAIDSLTDVKHRRLFRVLLGGVLIDLSNVVINGKGRRYRRGWERRDRSGSMVNDLFRRAVDRAITDIHIYGARPCLRYEVRRGDCRSNLRELEPCDLAVFSPPYPNSFDYTDVYNVELWMLGYLTNPDSNHRLRSSTLCSHVQVSRDFPPAPSGSLKLDRILDRLERRSAKLWGSRIPAVVAGYFNDLALVLRELRRAIVNRGRVWTVVGDSRYAGVRIATAEILAELAPGLGWRVLSVEPCRSMRVSAQQGRGLKL